jgi:hypothetical protein
LRLDWWWRAASYSSSQLLEVCSRLGAFGGGALGGAGAVQCASGPGESVFMLQLPLPFGCTQLRDWPRETEGGCRGGLLPPDQLPRSWTGGWRAASSASLAIAGGVQQTMVWCMAVWGALQGQISVLKGGGGHVETLTADRYFPAVPFTYTQLRAEGGASPGRLPGSWASGLQYHHSQLHSHTGVGGSLFWIWDSSRYGHCLR